MVTHLEPDILECEVKWALDYISKASGGYGTPAELFPILKDGAVKVLHSICQQIWKTQQWPQDWKRSAFIPVTKKGNAKECSAQFYSSHMLQSNAQNPCKLGFSNMWTENFQMFKLDLEKAEEPEIKLSTFIGSCRKQGDSRKTSTSASLITLKPLAVGSQQTGKSLKRRESQTSLHVPWKTCMQVEKQQFPNNWLVHSWERSTTRLYIVTLLI